MVITSICIAVAAVCAVLGKWLHLRFLRHVFDQTRDVKVLDHLPSSRTPLVQLQLPQRNERASP